MKYPQFMFCAKIRKIRKMSMRRFYEVPTIYVLRKSKKNARGGSMKYPQFMFCAKVRKMSVLDCSCRIIIFKPRHSQYFCIGVLT